MLSSLEVVDEESEDFDAERDLEALEEATDIEEAAMQGRVEGAALALARRGAVPMSSASINCFAGLASALGLTLLGSP